MCFPAAPLDVGLTCSLCLCAGMCRLNILSLLQPRITCVPCKEAMPYAPAASSPCLTGGQNVSRTPASPPSSVSKGVRVRCLPEQPPHHGACPVDPSRLRFQNGVDWEVKTWLCFLICSVGCLHAIILNNRLFPSTDNLLLSYTNFPCTGGSLPEVCIWYLSPHRDHNISIMCHFVF